MQAKILIVDDGAVDRKMAGNFVQEAGHVPAFAEDGEAALDAIEDDVPDIVLTDMRMPRMDGLELVRTLRETHPQIPVILMTAHGSEEVAVAALRAGASNYVGKLRLGRDLAQALEVVLDSMLAARERARVRDFLEAQETSYVLDYAPGAIRSLVSHLQDTLRDLHLCDETDLIRVGTALTEALANARDHGNLELDSALREDGGQAYRELGAKRSTEAPYKDRRTHVRVHITRDEATFVVRDEGPGFDHTDLPDPRDPENLLKPSGRGIVLIRTFMDDVAFNEQGNEITMRMRPGEGD